MKNFFRFSSSSSAFELDWLNVETLLSVTYSLVSGVCGPECRASSSLLFDVSIETAKSWNTDSLVLVFFWEFGCVFSEVPVPSMHLLQDQVHVEMNSFWTKTRKKNWQQAILGMIVFFPDQGKPAIMDHRKCLITGNTMNEKTNSAREVRIWSQRWMIWSWFLLLTKNSNL